MKTEVGYTYEFHRDGAGRIRVQMRQTGSEIVLDTVVPSVEAVLANPKRYWDNGVRTIVPFMRDVA